MPGVSWPRLLSSSTRQLRRQFSVITNFRPSGLTSAACLPTRPENFPAIRSYRPRFSAVSPSIGAAEEGVGEFLLLDALRRAYVQASQIAAVAAVVDAIDAQAAGFYRHFNFIPFPDRPDRLFLPMKSISTLFRTT